jgi:release factor glutamine methyltransferase
VITISAALQKARHSIESSEARLLLRYVLACSAAYLVAHSNDSLDPQAEANFLSLVERRERGEPIAYLLEAREFYGRVFAVAPGVLIPRPETELIVDLVLGKYRSRPGRTTGTSVRPEPVEGQAGTFRTGFHRLSPNGALALRILDLGTGSGCLAITLALELPNAEITAVDISPAALAIARQNADQLGAQVRWLESDWFSSLQDERFDLIVSNPPYIAAGDPHLGQGDLRFEPAAALASGADGLDAIRQITANAKDHMVSSGLLLFEHGYDQAHGARTLLEERGFSMIEQHRDLADIVRVSGGRKP